MTRAVDVRLPTQHDDRDEQDDARDELVGSPDLHGTSETAMRRLFQTNIVPFGQVPGRPGEPAR